MLVPSTEYSDQEAAEIWANDLPTGDFSTTINGVPQRTETLENMVNRMFEATKSRTVTPATPLLLLEENEI